MDQSVTPSGEPERWLPVVGYEGFYEVSDMGRVRSLSRTVRFGSNTRIVRGRILKPYFSDYYYLVGLSRDNKIRQFTVHVLVARAFIGPRPDGHDVCHGPCGQLDNRVANLSYGTHAKNLSEDKYRDGTMLLGIEVHNARLAEDIVRECRRRAGAGEAGADLAREFGVSTNAMYCAISGKTWRHVACEVVSLPVQVGEQHRSARLTEAAVRDIRIKHAGRLATVSDLACIYGVTESTIFQVISYRTWRHVTVPGAAKPPSKSRLTEENVREIRTRFAAGEPASSIAPRFSVSQGTVRGVASGRTWKHVA